MAIKFIHKVLSNSHSVTRYQNVGAMYTSMLFCHTLQDSHVESVSSDWHTRTITKMVELNKGLKNVDSVGGRLVNIDNGVMVFDDRIERDMRTFKSLVRAFIGSSYGQKAMKRKHELSFDCFTELSERMPVSLNTFTKICTFLNVSAQQRRVVRFTICPQVTQHRIWTSVLEEILNDLQNDMLLDKELTKELQMGQQIICSCLKFLSDTANSQDPGSISWMRLAPKKGTEPSSSPKWQDVLDMFNHLIKCIRHEKKLQTHVLKLEAMKEGLFQLKDVLVDKNIAYKEARHQESLVQKKLSKTLGHSSKCLFTLLSYFLYGSVKDIEIDLCGGVYKCGKGEKFYLYLGKVLTCDEEKMVRNGVKELDKALGMYKFVWESAGMTGVLELQGHLWCMQAKDRTLTYRGNTYFVHGISI